MNNRLCAVALLTLLPLQSQAVRVNDAGLGQALVYPYYTARGFAADRAYTAALSVTNTRPVPKAVKVRFLEGKAGAVVLDFNVFLNGNDMWTTGVIPAGAGAGIFSVDRSCTSPTISRNSATPTLFRNAEFAGDGLGDSLDRTYEGHVEVLEMGTIDPLSALGRSVTHRPDLSSPNASTPPCTGLPDTATVPTGLSPPTGGLYGNISLINVNEGTDYAVDTVALSQWSDKVQWSAPGSGTLTLAHASPAHSIVLDAADDGDRLISTRWSSGRDAVTAVLMVNHVMNDYSVEPSIRAATDVILSMPTKRFYVNQSKSELPFSPRIGASPTPATYHCQNVSALDSPFRYYDRESQTPVIFYFTVPLMSLCGSVAVGHLGGPQIPRVFPSHTVTEMPLESGWTSGWLDIQTLEASQLAAPSSATTITNLTTGEVNANVNATYFGLPIVGFAAQSYSTQGLPGINPNMLSNYGGNFAHRYKRRIEFTR